MIFNFMVGCVPTCIHVHGMFRVGCDCDIPPRPSVRIRTENTDSSTGLMSWQQDIAT